MNTEKLTVLLIEDNRGDYVLTRDLLEKASAELEAPQRYLITHVTRLEEAYRKLEEEEEFDLVLLDLSLPGDAGLDAFYKISRIIPEVPIVVLTGHTDESLAPQALQSGAQDYLIKGEIDSRALSRSVRFAAQRKRAERLHAGQSRVLEMVSTGEGLEKTLHTLVSTIEEQFPELLCSILLLDRNKQVLRHGAACSLPPKYVQQVDGVPIAEGIGSCGTAAFRKQRVVVEDIQKSALWDAYRSLAEEFGLHACWSQPILSATGTCLGTFAMYYRAPRIPSYGEINLIERAAHIAGIAIERNNSEQTLQESQDKLYQSEAQLRSALENAPIGIATSDIRGRFLSVNQAFCKILGYSAKEMLSCTLQHFTFSEDVSRARELFCKARKGEVSKFQLELRCLHKSGVPIECIVRVGTVYSPEQKPSQFVIEVEDVTEKKKWEAEHLKATKLESLGILAGGIAHDFNNILMAIVGSTSLAKLSTPKNSETFRRLREIENAAHRARELTQQLLTFAKGGAPIKQTASVRELIRDTVKFTLHGQKAKCDIDIPEDLWHVDIDAGQMSQVINNLILNAYQAMPGGGHIQVNCENIVATGESAPQAAIPSGKLVKITIRDQGRGIPPETLDKIFDPYFTTKEKGTGLGLATTYSIIRKHQGQITVESRIGVGTTFRIYLPASTKILPKAFSLQKQIEKEYRLHKGHGRVLLMDDEDIVRSTAGDMLQLMGYEVTFALDGAEALKYYQDALRKKQPFDIVIMDLTIPGGMGGRRLIQHLRKLDPSVRAIASSGYSDDPIMADFAKYGFCGVAPKPYEISTLGQILSTIPPHPHEQKSQIPMTHLFL